MSHFLKSRKALTLSASGLTFVAVTLCAATRFSAAKTGGVSDVDKNFLIATNESNLSEVAYSPVVMKRASSASAKNFARHMVEDHTKANRKVTVLARRLGVKLPQAVPDEERAVINRLAQERGSKFNLAYQNEMIRDHMEDISDAEREISLGSNAQAKALASELLVALRVHLDMAQTMNGKPHPMRHHTMDDMDGNSVSNSAE